MNEQQFRALCEEKGYGDIRIKDYEPDSSASLHTHDQSVIVLVLDGKFTLEKKDDATTYGVGEICELEAGTLHAEKTGSEGARIIAGFK